MSDHDFTTTVSVGQTPHEAYSAILNVDGWWTGSNEGKCDEVGDEFIHRDGEAHYCKLRVTGLAPNKRVTWLVLDNHFTFVENQDEWKDTQITFEIAAAEGQAQVSFRSSWPCAGVRVFRSLFERMGFTDQRKSANPDNERKRLDRRMTCLHV